MPIRSNPTPSKNIEIVGKMKVSNDGGISWIKLLLLKLPAILGGGFGFIIPALAAEGSNFLTAETALPAALKIIAGGLLVLLGLFA